MKTTRTVCTHLNPTSNPAQFSVLVLGYDTIWGVGGRPDWITQARTYPFVNAASEAMVTMISERREEMRAADQASTP